MLMRMWMRRGPLAWALLPLSWLFRILGALRRSLYEIGIFASLRLPVPVIVVGNIFVGGTGKTPVAIWLVEALRAQGYTPGVVSRGYGGDASSEVKADSDPRRVGDEPVLIAQRAACPVMVGRKRAETARRLLAAHPAVDVIVCDDGLQHYALQRDIEILLFDERGMGNAWLMPAGPLREPPSRRCDITLVNAAQSVPGMPSDAIYSSLIGTTAQRLSDPTQTLALSSLASADGAKRIAAAAGIGNPARFFAMLRRAGLHCAELPLSDHYDYADNPFANIDADVILITEKDAVKCRHLAALKSDSRLWVVPVSAQPEGILLERILEKLRGLSTA
jgi:tetraacyldisaccharide 4'-kinase